MDTSEYEDVKENLLVEGLRDWIRLGEIHCTFLFDNHIPKRPVAEAQRLTLSMIREVVAEGLFDLGEIVRRTNDGFEAWNLPLDEAMAKIEEKYVENFDDRWGWTACAWLQLTEKGRALALQLYHFDHP
ncbi:hypothetical protein A5662_25375 [Mycobacteriaceae bacterium 1482268.1]|nr:hypothetical protein A5662_25375 [Mycobacteriaceae bacterium 1482268.1]